MVYVRRIFFFILITLLTGCVPPGQVPDLRTIPDGPEPVFLIDRVDELAVVNNDGTVLPDAGVRLDIVKIANTVARGLSSNATGKFRWRGEIAPNAYFTCLIGVGSAPLGLFNVLGIIPPITSYGNIEGEPPEGVTFRLLADGEQVFEYLVPREDFTAWEPISISLEEYAGEDVELTFEAEGIIIGTKLPYWGHPEILATRENPRRIILLGLDTVAAGHVGWMGYDRQTTPNLDMIAQDSTIFMDAHSSSPWTLPAFAAVLSGRPPGVTGADRRNRGISDHEDMLAEVFRRNGFATCGIVNTPPLQEAGFFQGSDHHWEAHDYPAPQGLLEARNWIENHRDQDFFIFIHLFDPHIPYKPEDRWAERFSDPAYSGDYAEMWDLPGGMVTQNHTDPSVWASLSEADREQCENLYDAEIAGMDEALGTFFNWYQSEGLLDESTVIVFADNGEEFGEHGRWEHGHSEYEEQIHVPLMVKLPGQTQSRCVEGLVGTIDIYPTLMELLGFTSETESTGLSLVPMLNGGSPDPDRMIISESTLWGPEIKSVTTNRYKYILNVQSGIEELYDLVNDPGELTDISSENPEIVEDLGGYLENYVNETQSG